MLKRIFISIVVFTFFQAKVTAQNNQATIKFRVFSSSDKSSLPFANIILSKSSTQMYAVTTDMDGVAYMRNVQPGKYDMKGVYTGYSPYQMKDVIILGGQTNYFDLPMVTKDSLPEVQIYSESLVKKHPEFVMNVNAEQYNNSPIKDIPSLLSLAPTVYQSDIGKELNVAGGRSYGTNTYIDGERVIGTAYLPQSSIQQLSLMLAGIPAQFGDVTSGFISIITKGPQPKIFGSVEAISSQLTDKYGYNFMGFSLGGPLYTKKVPYPFKKDSLMPRSVLGFFIAGEIVYQKDPAPWSTGINQVNSAKLNELESHPLTYNQLTKQYVLSSSYLNSNDMYVSAARPNVASRAVRLNPKIDFSPTDNLHIILGGSVDYNNYKSFIYDYSLLNSQHNPQTVQNAMRGYVRITQRFGNDDGRDLTKKQSLFKNSLWTVQGGYQRFTSLTQDVQFTNNFFQYGYVGRFNEYQMPFYYLAPTATLQNPNGGPATQYNTPTYVFGGYIDTLITFNPGSQNPLTANYTSQLMSDLATRGVKVWNYSQIYQNNGLRNGDRPNYVQSLWSNTGRTYPNYIKNDNSIFRFTTSFSTFIKDHSIMAGVEYDQRNERGFTLNPVGLWGQMRQLANMHNQNMDPAQMIYHAAGTYTVTNMNPLGPNGYDNSYGVIGPQTPYDPNAPIQSGILYQGSQQSVFSKNFYDQVMHLPYKSTRYINIDQYSPSDFNLGMFSPDELLNSGVSLVNAYGYDYNGNRLAGNGRISFSDFLNKYHTDKFNDTVHDRLTGAFRPIYMAGYIQDQFDFEDIKFNVGLRVDRYDANQQVLKDKYLLKEAYHVSDLTSLSNSHAPSGIPSDAVVYVDNNNTGQAKSVVGYRSGDTWYDAQGNIIADPKVIADGGGGQAQPWLVNPSDKSSYSNSAFTGYKPQVNIMPRLAFSFPIASGATFFAHYDILTQRPLSTFSRMDPTNWYFMAANQGMVFNNPDLKPERTIDYQVGFSQALNESGSAAIKLTSFYREMRNLTQIVRVNQAYPISYLTYGNIDFSTVKGFTAELFTRRRGGLSMNISYTLQFAEGSGSNANGGYNLASTSQPNLRVIMPLDFDQRHKIGGSIDYRFGQGKDYKGPQTSVAHGKKVIRWFEGIGFNILPRLGSGTPYTRRNPPKADEEVGNNITQSITGDLNGSRYPWQFRTDMRIDKTIMLTRGKGENRKINNLNIYLQVLNLFNTQNILAVHNYTGSPKDDGYLSSNLGITEVNQKYNQGAAYAQAFVSQYNAKLNDGTYYSMPRMIRVGVQYDF